MSVSLALWLTQMRKHALACFDAFQYERTHGIVVGAVCARSIIIQYDSIFNLSAFVRGTAT